LFKLNPEIGQMLIFKSEVEHEVVPAHKTRYALTGWMRK
ncbi:MAG: 2OG-Fe(II) oxygenase, partial [Pseudobdellovibrio sp.]